MDPQDHERFRDFVDARWSALLRLANLLTGGDRHEAEDLVQTALMKALAAGGTSRTRKVTCAR